jgi:hypothetical protein
MSDSVIDPQTEDYIFGLQRIRKELHPLKTCNCSWVPLSVSCPHIHPKLRTLGVKSFKSSQYMVCCLKVTLTDTNGTFHDADLSLMASETWIIRHHLVYHKNDDSVVVKTLKPRKKYNHRQNKVSIFSHITTIPATLPTF